MTTHLEIESLADDNGKSLFRSQRVKINGKEAITPLKALDTTKFRSNTKLNKNAYGFSEIYRKIGSDKINQLLTDADEHDRYSRELTRIFNRSHSTDLNICVLKFSPNTPNQFPSRSDIELLTDIAHSFSDITPIPLPGVKIDKTNFSSYMSYLQLCYDTIEEFNNKPIMGTIPRLPRELYPKLLDFYAKNQITSFCFDFDGRTPDHLKLRPIIRHLKTKKILEQTLIYGINAKPGKTLKNINVIPSKDFTAYGFGLDILGENHIGPKGYNPNLQISDDKKLENRKRIFIKSDYGYYKTTTGEEIRESYPNDTAIKLDDMLHEQQSTLQKLFNMEQQSLEAGKIRSDLNILDKNETILTYIEGKEYARNEISRFKVAVKDASQTTL